MPQWSLSELCSPSLVLVPSFTQQFQTALSKDIKVVSTCQLLKFFSPTLSTIWLLYGIFDSFQHCSFEFSSFSETIWPINTFILGTQTLVPLVNSLLIHCGLCEILNLLHFSPMLSCPDRQKMLKPTSISRWFVGGQKGLLISAFLVPGSHCQ